MAIETADYFLPTEMLLLARNCLDSERSARQLCGKAAARETARQKLTRCVISSGSIAVPHNEMSDMLRYGLGLAASLGGGMPIAINPTTHASKAVSLGSGASGKVRWHLITLLQGWCARELLDTLCQR